MVKLQDVS